VTPSRPDVQLSPHERTSPTQPTRADPSPQPFLKPSLSGLFAPFSVKHQNGHPTTRIDYAGQRYYYHDHTTGPACASVVCSLRSPPLKGRTRRAEAHTMGRGCSRQRRHGQEVLERYVAPYLIMAFYAKLCSMLHLPQAPRCWRVLRRVILRFIIRLRFR
jgi:hypothetical protein